MKKCINFFIAFLCCLFFSCDMEIEEILRQKRLEYISVDTTEAVKLEYLIGDNFNSEGIKIYGHYSDETQVEEDLRLVSFSGFDSSQAAEKNTITVLFNEKETTFDVKIHESKIEKIQIIQKPIKQFFRVGESNDTTGIIVKAIYTNGNETPLAEDEYILEGFDSSKAGMCLVNVILKADTKIYDAYTVVFQDYDIKEIKISKNPNKLIYMVGEELDLTGLEVYATPENGLPPFLLPQYNYSPASIKDITATGKQTITINVNEVKASFDIEIVDAYVKGFVIKDKDGNGKPMKNPIIDSGRIYSLGDTFSLEHFEFYELYSNDAIGEEITKENKKMEKLSFYFIDKECKFDEVCKFGGEPGGKPGVYTIPIRYEFEDVTTKTNTSSTIEIKVCVTDSEIERIEADWSIEKAFGYPKGITPDNSNPIYGKWTVKAILKNGEEVSIGAEYCTYEYVDREITENTETDVRVTYYDIRTKTEYMDIEKVTVIEPILQKVEIVNLPKTQYVVGDEVKLDDLEVEGTYSDGKKKSIVYSSYEPERIGNNDNQIKVNYENGVTCTIPIKKIENDVIEIREEPSPEFLSENFYFREGKKYEWNFFDEYFSVYKRRVNGAEDKIEDDKQKLNYTIKEGSIIIVYNLGKITYSTIYENKSISILSALPTSVEILPNVTEDYNGLNGIINSPTTKLKVKYANLKEEEITKGINNIFTDKVGKYELKQTDYGINVKFIAEKLAVDESESERTITFKNVLSKNKIIVENENGFNDEFSFKQENDEYGFAQKYYVYMEFNNGQRQEIESNGSLTFTPLLTSYNYEKAFIEDKLLVNYTDTTDTSYYCTYYNVTYLPPKPSTIDVDLKEQPGNGDSEETQIINIGTRDEIFNKLSWTVEYEDGSKLSEEDNSEEDNKDQRWIPTFQIVNGFIELKGKETGCNLTVPKISVNEYPYENSYIIIITKGNSSLWFELPKQVDEASEEEAGETQ